MDKKYTYLKSDCKEAQWLAEVHAAGYPGVLCKVWTDNSISLGNEFIIYQTNNGYVDAGGETWTHAKPIITEHPEPKGEDPRLAALQAGVVVTSENAVVGAEAISLRYGKVSIARTSLEYGRTNCELSEIGDDEESVWEADGKVYDSDMYPDLYYPAGKVPEREPECEVVKVKIRPFITAEQGHQALSHESTISMFDNSNFNGPEQEVEIKIYKPGKNKTN